MYADYPIRPTLFHWESQSTTSVDSPTGRRYLDGSSTVLLFVRHEQKDEFGTSPYLFLGPAYYVSHTGDRPIAITWKIRDTRCRPTSSISPPRSRSDVPARHYAPGMRIVVGVTDNRWATFLRDHGDLTEANFWQPSPHGFKALAPGEPFPLQDQGPQEVSRRRHHGVCTGWRRLLRRIRRVEGQRGMDDLGGSQRRARRNGVGSPCTFLPLKGGGR